MLDELRDLAQKKAKAEKTVNEFNSKKEQEKIRKGVQSGRLKEFFEPVTKAIEKIPETKIQPQVGELVPVPNLMNFPIDPPAIEGPEEPQEPQEPQGAQGPQIVEMEPGGVNISKYDAEEQLGDYLDDEDKISKAKGMNVTLGKLKSGSKFPQDIKYLMDKNRKYYQKLQGKTGKGLASKGSYKLDTTGTFSDLLLDLEQLLEHNRLYGLDNKGKQVLNERVDDDFVDLVTKRYNPKKRYSDSAKRMFRNLVSLSSHPLVRTSGKYKNILCDNASSLVDRLELLVASIEYGNTSDELVNEGMSILDTLLENGDITEDQHEGIYRKYFE